MVMSEPPPIEHQPIRRMKRVEYDLLVKQGLFDRERVELIFGQVVQMSPIDRAHVLSVQRIHKALLLALVGKADVACQMPFAATDDSEPEPDVYVTPPSDSWTEHPSRAYLVVEVARSSLDYDSNEKAFLYGISEVDEYWIVDHNNGVVRVHRNRSRGKWRTVTTHRRGEKLSPLAFTDVVIEVSEILPPE